MGGDPSAIAIATRTRDTICGHVSDSHPSPVSKWIQSSKLGNGDTQNEMVPELRLECGSGQQISHIVYASFGNSTGSCGSFQRGACHAALSTAVIEKVNELYTFKEALCALVGPWKLVIKTPNAVMCSSWCRTWDSSLKPFALRTFYSLEHSGTNVVADYSCAFWAAGMQGKSTMCSTAINRRIRWRSLSRTPKKFGCTGPMQRLRVSCGELEWWWVFRSTQ